MESPADSTVGCTVDERTSYIHDFFKGWVAWGKKQKVKLKAPPVLNKIEPPIIQDNGFFLAFSPIPQGSSLLFKLLILLFDIYIQFTIL